MMLTRRDFVLRTIGGLALMAIPAPLMARVAPNAVPAPIPSPIGEFSRLPRTEGVLFDLLHRDFPQYAFWQSTPYLDPNHFCVRRGLLAAGPVTKGKPFKLRTCVNMEFLQDLEAYHGLDAMDELVNVVRQEIARELEMRKYERLVSEGDMHPLDAMVIDDLLREAALAKEYTFPYYTNMHVVRTEDNITFFKKKLYNALGVPQ
jgi:major capsid protein Gp23